MNHCKHQKRIMLWTNPRCVSTAFCRAMLSRTKTKVFIEPYASAYYHGPDRVSKRYLNDPIRENDTFENISYDLAKDYQGYDTVFAKDMAYFLRGRLHTTKYLPKGYIHTFLIRNPSKAITSLYKMSKRKDLTGWDYFDKENVGFKEQLEMYKLVSKDLGQEPIILDADDLLNSPEEMLRIYCEKVGIEYQESMVHWKRNPVEILNQAKCGQTEQVLGDFLSWFGRAFSTDTFEQEETPFDDKILDDLPQDVKDAVEDSKIYYNQLWKMRLQPKNIKSVPNN